MGILTEGYVTFQKYVDYPKKCYAHNFVMTINGEGCVFFCKNTRDNPLFYIGSLYKETVSQIWKNSKIKKDLEKNIKPANCATFCKNMQINKAIEDLINNKVSLDDYKNLELEHKNFP